MDKTEEKKFVQKAKTGDRQAFDRLVRSCADKNFNSVLRMCGSAHMAEDIMQDAFINAYKNIVRFREDSSFAGWVYRIAVNVWKNRVRYEKRRKFFSHFSLFSKKEGEDETEAQIPDSAASPEEELDLKLKKEKVQQALSALPEHIRAMVVMRDMEELSYGEIAETLGLSMGTVKSRISRARQVFKEKMIEISGGGKNGL